MTDSSSWAFAGCMDVVKCLLLLLTIRDLFLFHKHTVVQIQLDDTCQQLSMDTLATTSWPLETSTFSRTIYLLTN